MSLNSFIENLQNHPEINLSAQKLSLDKTKIHWTGIFGSAKSIFASGVAQQCPGHHVFVLNDKEEAAYFLNDLQGLYPEDHRLVFYPASYKVPYQIALDIMYSNSPVSHIEDFNQWLVSTCGLTQQEADAYVLYQPKDIPTFLKG